MSENTQFWKEWAAKAKDLARCPSQVRNDTPGQTSEIYYALCTGVKCGNLMWYTEPKQWGCLHYKSYEEADTARREMGHPEWGIVLSANHVFVDNPKAAPPIQDWAQWVSHTQRAAGCLEIGEYAPGTGDAAYKLLTGIIVDSLGNQMSWYDDYFKSFAKADAKRKAEGHPEWPIVFNADHIFLDNPQYELPDLK